MKHISELLTDAEYKLRLKKVKSRRSVILKEIVDNLKRERKDNPVYLKDGKWKKLKPIQDKVIAIRASHFTMGQLEDLASACKHAKNYSATFWYLTRTTLATENESNIIKL